MILTDPDFDIFTIHLFGRTLSSAEMIRNELLWGNRELYILLLYVCFYLHSVGIQVQDHVNINQSLTH